MDVTSDNKYKILMQKKSLKNNIIEYNRATLEQNIEELLLERFWEEHLVEKTIDDLHDPYLLKDMEKAVERIKQAKKDDEKVMIFGDYDVDWVTSTSILMHFFQKINLKASYRLPHRVKDGYIFSKKNSKGLLDRFSWYLCYLNSGWLYEYYLRK